MKKQKFSGGERVSFIIFQTKYKGTVIALNDDTITIKTKKEFYTLQLPKWKNPYEIKKLVKKKKPMTYQEIDQAVNDHIKVHCDMLCEMRNSEQKRSPREWWLVIQSQAISEHVFTVESHARSFARGMYGDCYDPSCVVKVREVLDETSEES